MKKRWIGIDVGGANIKAADSAGWTSAKPFALWKQPRQLSSFLQAMLPAQDASCRYVLTMTGELADCFADREQGVCAIVDAVAEATGNDGNLLVYSLCGGWFCGDKAKRHPDDVAAANWHAMAAYAARYLGPAESGLLIDIGSTTTDLIPINSRGVMTSSRTDNDRLKRSELLYFGIARTPLCALTASLPFRGQAIPVMAEHFATTDDCSLVLGRTEPAADDCDSADGQPRTVENSVNRIARMIGLDRRSYTHADAVIAATEVESILQHRVAAAIRTVAPEAAVWLVSGHGEWLIPDSRMRRVWLRQEIGGARSRVGPAYALACLAQERFA